jgi:hypothetical protein
MTYTIESTDAIHDGNQWSGNYSRVDRHTFTMPDDATPRQVWAKARSLVGLSGVRGRYVYDDAWMPYRTATIVFLYDEELLLGGDTYFGVSV